ncbi:helix-turn-helix domain-containing protein [Ferrimonas gelatinilytica]|uniref:HTH cro/C1-type domain-containing protein n=1 Tax=Ferrimonas gelatinilytica TaxID=1255257 RepID=A0ABP9RZD2_9GAMM
MAVDKASREAAERRLIQRANELGVKQVDLVRATGKGKSTVNGWFVGKGFPTGVTLIKVCRALRCSVEWLVMGEGAVAPASPAHFVASLPGAWEWRHHPGANHLRLPRLTLDGNDQVEVRLASRDMLKRSEHPEAAAWLPVVGACAEPVVALGDLALVDTGCRSIEGSGEYWALAYSGGIAVHRCHTDPSGSIILEDASRPSGAMTVARGDIKVLGKVFMRYGPI